MADSASDRVACACRLVTHRRGLWEECGWLWGYPDWLLKHSLVYCARLREDGMKHEGPVMARRPAKSEGV
jgi:hypothetical protein